jgi:hypothetical protein
MQEISMSKEDEFSSAFNQFSAAVEVMSEVLEKSPLALSALHVGRESGPDYTIVNREVFEMLEAKASAWDEAQRDPCAEDVAEAYLLAKMKSDAEGGS